MAGYSGTPLVKKIGIKPSHRVAVVDSPNGFAKELGPMPEDAKFVPVDGTSKPGTLDVVILFLESRANLEKQLPKLKTKIAQAGMIWAAWPKKASLKSGSNNAALSDPRALLARDRRSRRTHPGVETGLNENIIRDTALALGFE